jgi:lipoate-protein ligase A
VILVDNRQSSNPYINLAIEEFLVRHANCETQDYLLFYINEPCIVVGKNQSIWKEVNFEYLRNGQLKLCRRISGGGTVFHDKGNLSFAFISKFSDEKISNYKLFNQPIVDALRQAGVKAEMDKRNNILCKGKKISGSAQFTNRKNIISHGTLLLNANLDTLRVCLKENNFEINTRAVGSIRSSVMNIADATNQFQTCEDLKGFLAETLGSRDVYPFNRDEWNTIEKLAEEKFSTLEWIYGRSPHTRIVRQGTEIEIENGIVSSINNGHLATGQLKGIYYQFDAIKKALSDLPKASAILKQIF